MDVHLQAALGPLYAWGRTRSAWSGFVPFLCLLFGLTSWRVSCKSPSYRH